MHRDSILNGFLISFNHHFRAKQSTADLTPFQIRNKILSHCCQKVDTLLGIRNLVIVLILGLLGLRTSTIIALDLQDIDIFNGLIFLKEKGFRKRIMVMPRILW